MFVRFYSFFEFSKTEIVIFTTYNLFTTFDHLLSLPHSLTHTLSHTHTLWRTHSLTHTPTYTRALVRGKCVFREVDPSIKWRSHLMEQTHLISSCVCVCERERVLCRVVHEKEGVCMFTCMEVYESVCVWVCVRVCIWNELNTKIPALLPSWPSKPSALLLSSRLFLRSSVVSAEEIDV